MLTLQQYCVPITKATEFQKDANFNKHIYDLHFVIDPPMDSRKRKLTNEFIDDANDIPCEGVLQQVIPTKRKKIQIFEELCRQDCEEKKLCSNYSNFNKKTLLKNDKSPSVFSTAPSFSQPSGFTRFDSSNKSACKNYELRPRTFLRRPLYKRDSLDEDSLAAVDVFSNRKEKSAHRLSKYRRRTANARERHRMKEINDAFKSLREVLPQPIKMKESNLTKITTLRLAVDYIQALDDLLRDPDLHLNNPSYGIQGSIKECSKSLQHPNQENAFPNDSIGNSLSEFIFGLSPSSSPFSESVCELSSSSTHPVPAHTVSAHPIPAHTLPPIPKNKDFKINNSMVTNFSNYSFNYDDDALLSLHHSYEGDSSTIESIAILLSTELDDDVF